MNLDELRTIAQSLDQAAVYYNSGLLYALAQELTELIEMAEEESHDLT